MVRAGRVCTVARAPLCPTMAWHIARTEADVVHLHLPNPGAVIAYLASGHRGKLVLTEHGEVLGRPVLRRAFQPFMAAALRRAEAVIATSAEYIAQSSVLSAAPEKCRVIPLGIRTDTYARVEPAKVAEIQARYPGPAFLAIGRLVRFKGFEYAVRALAFAPGLLLIAGDGPLMAPLREIARSCGVADRVHLLGSIANHELVPYLHAADVLVMPSIEKRESFQHIMLQLGQSLLNAEIEHVVKIVAEYVAGQVEKLAITKAIVEAHDGEIAARNRKEGGLEIRITLPIEEQPVLKELPNE